RLIDNLRLAMFSERLITTAIGANGQEVVVPRDRVRELVFDLESNALLSLDGAVIWRLVRVRAVALRDNGEPDLRWLMMWAESVARRIADDGRQLTRQQFNGLVREQSGRDLLSK